MTQRTGQCLCGAVSFTLASEPLATRVCWCRDCQHLAANGTVNAVVHTAALEVTGTLANFVKTADSGNQITRQFCPRCGTHLFAMSSARPELRVVRAGNLENPSSIQPGMNIWTTSAPTWACLDQDLQQIAQQPVPPPPPVTDAS